MLWKYLIADGWFRYFVHNKLSCSKNPFATRHSRCYSCLMIPYHHTVQWKHMIGRVQVLIQKKKIVEQYLISSLFFLLCRIQSTVSEFVEEIIHVATVLHNPVSSRAGVSTHFGKRAERNVWHIVKGRKIFKT